MKNLVENAKLYPAIPAVPVTLAVPAIPVVPEVLAMPARRLPQETLSFAPRSFTNNVSKNQNDRKE